jgi:hypothetical protein
MGYAADRANQIGRRVEQRFPTRIASVISSGDTQVFGTLEDISASGAKFDTDYVANLGERVSIRGVALDISGTIIWRKGRKCGVSFDRPIDPLHVVRRNAMVDQRHGSTAGRSESRASPRHPN